MKTNILFIPFYILLCLVPLSLLPSCVERPNTPISIEGPQLKIKLLPAPKGKVTLTILSSQDMNIKVRDLENRYDDGFLFQFEKPSFRPSPMIWEEPNPVLLHCLLEEEGYGKAEITLNIEAYKHPKQVMAPVIQSVAVDGDYCMNAFTVNSFDKETAQQRFALLLLSRKGEKATSTK